MRDDGTDEDKHVTDHPVNMTQQKYLEIYQKARTKDAVLESSALFGREL